MVKQLGAGGGSGLEEPPALEIWSARLSRALQDAQGALAAGDAVQAERAGKAVSALCKALKDVEELNALALGQRPEENDEELRANLERRIARFIGADRAEDLLGEPDGSGAQAPQP
ncbi:MAG: hypothetical protein JNJ73_00300 [Hyphomonadaceae bacterium]|nr:hypothetical protein [Hyphomonadaceae bacterium]